MKVIKEKKPTAKLQIISNWCEKCQSCKEKQPKNIKNK